MQLRVQFRKGVYMRFHHRFTVKTLVVVLGLSAGLALAVTSIEKEAKNTTSTSTSATTKTAAVAAASPTATLNKLIATQAGNNPTKAETLKAAQAVFATSKGQALLKSYLKSAYKTNKAYIIKNKSGDLAMANLKAELDFAGSTPANSAVFFTQARLNNSAAFEKALANFTAKKLNKNPYYHGLRDAIKADITISLTEKLAESGVSATTIGQLINQTVTAMTSSGSALLTVFKDRTTAGVNQQATYTLPSIIRALLESKINATTLHNKSKKTLLAATAKVLRNNSALYNTYVSAHFDHLTQQAKVTGGPLLVPFLNAEKAFIRSGFKNAALSFSQKQLGKKSTLLSALETFIYKKLKTNPSAFGIMRVLQEGLVKETGISFANSKTFYTHFLDRVFATEKTRKAFMSGASLTVIDKDVDFKGLANTYLFSNAKAMKQLLIYNDTPVRGKSLTFLSTVIAKVAKQNPQDSIKENYRAGFYQAITGESYPPENESSTTTQGASKSPHKTTPKATSADKAKARENRKMLRIALLKSQYLDAHGATAMKKLTSANWATLENEMRDMAERYPSGEYTDWTLEAINAFTAQTTQKSQHHKTIQSNTKSKSTKAKPASGPHKHEHTISGKVKAVTHSGSTHSAGTKAHLHPSNKMSAAYIDSNATQADYALYSQAD
jgi:hypothetical protein